MAKFQPGVSGNPTGKPKGAKDKRTALRQLLVPHQEKLVETLIAFAEAGDMSAMRIVMDRLMPPLREEPIHVTIPKITNADDCTKAQAAVLNAVAAGEMLPGEGQVLSGLINAQRLAYETTHLAKQLADIQEDLDKIKSKGNS
jgi:hypothetical protein